MVDSLFFDSASLALAGPECLLVLVGVVLVGVDLVWCGERPPLPALTLFGLLATLGLVVVAPTGVGFGGMFVVDAPARFVKVICLVGAALAVLLAERNRWVEDMPQGEYYALLVFAVAGMLVMTSAADLVLLYLGLELMSLAVYCLVGLAKRQARATEAAMKYFLMGAFGSALFLYGVSLVYAVAGTTDLAAICAQVTGAGATASPTLLLAGVGLLVVGLCFKVGAAPFHQWTPDVYEGAPTGVTAFMSVAPKAASFAVLARVLLTGLLPLDGQWKMLLAAIALLTMTVGNVAALAQRSIKRMLAYSSIAHVGYALLGVLAGTDEGVAAMLSYLFIYAFMNMGAFAVLVALADRADRREALDDYRGLAVRHPVLAALMLLFMFSLAGIPPTAGFVGKFSLLMAAVHAGYLWLAVAAVLLSAVSAYFYLRVVRYMYMAGSEGGGQAVGVAGGVALVLSIAALGVVGMGVVPGGLTAVASQIGWGMMP